ncbi:hypothetical protein, partial [Escherichia coli]|uniref:hypothetical protein n=1 Tax=Escherichia coli TaxID=562 RepID=UPI00287606EF
MSVGSTHHLEVVFVWKQNYILVDEYFFFCCTWIVNSAVNFTAGRYLSHPADWWRTAEQQCVSGTHQSREFDFP